MKRIFSILFAVMFAGQAWAAEATTFTVGKLKYTVTDETNHYVSVGKGSTKPTGALNIQEKVTNPNDGLDYMVTSIWFYGFENCSGLIEVTIPNSVTGIGYAAFSGCSGLTSVTIPNSVASIDDHAFSGCSGLTTVTIPNSVTNIGDYAFRGCSGLTSVTIGNLVTSIGRSAFCDCGGLTSVTIGNSVTSIGEGAFENCSGLTEVTIPNSVTSIDNDVFFKCSGLTGINVDPNNTNYESENGVLFNKGKTELICYPASKTETTYTIPNSVTGIGYAAFSGCSGLTSVTIPNSVTSISFAAFENCNGLTSVSIPNSVTSIGEGAFYGCGGLASVTIGNSVTSMGYDAFFNCSKLTSVTIPNSVTSVGSSAFSGCSNATLYCECEETSKPSGWSSSWNAQTKWGCMVVSVDNHMVDRVTGEITGENYELIDGNGALWFLHDAIDPMATVTFMPDFGYHWGDGINNRIPRVITEPVTASKTYWSEATAWICEEMIDAAVPATCTEPGKTLGKHCSVCEAVLVAQENIPALGHTPDSIEFENIVLATCTAAGSKDSVVFCSVCEVELSREERAIPALGHTYSNTVTAPTCTAVGYTTHTCSVCEYTYNSDTVAANGHTEVVDAAVPATCTEAGKTEGIHCSVCETVLVAQEAVAALGHTEVIDAAVPATCTETGKTEGKHCSVCNETILAQAEIPALGHEFKEYIYNNDATTTADGTETATCTRGCGATDTRTAAGTKLAETPEKGTAVTESAANAVTIYAHHNTIVVENATDEISIYNAMGTLICRDATPCVRTEINVNAPGVYIVKTGNVVKRVAVE